MRALGWLSVRVILEPVSTFDHKPAVLGLLTVFFKIRSKRTACLSAWGFSIVPRSRSSDDEPAEQKMFPRVCGGIRKMGTAWKNHIIKAASSQSGRDIHHHSANSPLPVKTLRKQWGPFNLWNLSERRFRWVNFKWDSDSLLPCVWTYHPRLSPVVGPFANEWCLFYVILLRLQTKQRQARIEHLYLNERFHFLRDPDREAGIQLRLLLSPWPSHC